MEIINGIQQVKPSMSVDQDNTDDVVCLPFPEDWYPCPTITQEEYEKRLLLGHECMAQSKVVICGLARDVADTLPITCKRVESLGEQFADYKVLVIENDSQDSSIQILNRWTETNPAVVLDSQSLNQPAWTSVTDLSRAKQLAQHRNRYLNWMADNATDADFAITLDFDLHKGWSLDGLQHSFGYQGWHVMGSNGVTAPYGQEDAGKSMFFDAWAFRHVGDTQPRPFEQINQLRYPRGTPPFRVWSCFGGLAIYTLPALLCGSRYVGGDCEHVTFHQGLRKRGYEQIYLNPNQLVFY